MSGPSEGPPRAANRLLAALPAMEYDRLRPRAELVTPGIKEPLYAAGRPIAHVYFPLSGVFSMVATMDDGAIMEVATIGSEGMVGLPAFLGAGTSPLTTFAQVEGEALRLAAATLRELAGPGSRLHDRLQRYTQALFILTAQSVACNRLHPVEARCGRWLLMTHDRVGGAQFPLTHEFLAQMLGVRRASVTEVAGRLQTAGLIRYQRGVITVLDRPGLEASACECYRGIRGELDRLLG